MSCIDANNIQNLVEQIEALKKTPESIGNGGQIKLMDIDLDDVLDGVPRTADGRLDAKTWGGLGEGRQRELHSKLSCVLGALKAATCPGAPMAPKDICSYGAALIATLIFLPSMATFFTVIIILLDNPSSRITHLLNVSLKHVDAPVWGTVIALVVWLVLGLFCCKFADAKKAIPSSYGELLPRLDELEIGLKGICPTTEYPIKPCGNVAYYEAAKEHYEIRRDLTMKGLSWLLATEYSKVWGRLYRAEEAMIEVTPQKKVFEGAYYDEARLDGSDIKNRDDLLAKLRKAVVSIDPSARKYLKSTTAITVPPALAIGTTALPGVTVAVGYCVALVATGGVPPYKWEVRGGALPEGLVLSTAGVLRGTPLNDGHGNFTVQVTDGAGVAAEKAFDLLISPQTTQSSLAFSTTPPLPWGTVDVEYTERLFTTGGKPPYAWLVIGGALPEGTDLSKEGVLSGKPLKGNEFKFTAEVTDSTGTSPIKREFTLLIKPSGTGTVVPVGGTQPEQLARVVLRYVRNSLNEYRNARWNGMILARNRLLATFMLTGMIVFALLTIAVMYGAERSTIIAATVFYLVGATVGLCNRLRSESQVESAIADYGLSAARLITIPLFSGLGAIGGLLFVAYLPFATPIFTPTDIPPSPDQQSIVETGAPKTPTPVAGNKKTSTAKASAPETGTAKKNAPKTPANGTNEKKLPPPPKLDEIFNFDKNLIGLFVAAVFGLAPGLLFDRLQKQADRYKAELKSSQSTEEAKKP